MREENSSETRKNLPYRVEVTPKEPDLPGEMGRMKRFFARLFPLLRKQAKEASEIGMTFVDLEIEKRKAEIEEIKARAKIARAQAASTLADSDKKKADSAETKAKTAAHLIELIGSAMRSPTPQERDLKLLAIEISHPGIVSKYFEIQGSLENLRKNRGTQFRDPLGIDEPSKTDEST